MNLRTLITLCMLMLVAAQAHAQRTPSLEPGSEAPSMNIEEWLHGEQFSIEPGKVYIIEFWATWCAPCRAAIPHLSRLQERYHADGLRIVGISNEEKDDVEDFLNRNRRDISYAIAIDARNQTNRAWMQAAGVQGIPASFIVDRQGKVQFIGNPHTPQFDNIVAAVLDDRYDPKLQAESRDVIQAIENARRMRNWRQSRSLMEELIAVDPHKQAFVALDKFHMMLVDMGDEEQAYQYARELRKEKYSDDATLLLMLSELIALDPSIDSEKRDMDFALELAQHVRNIAPPRLEIRSMAHQARVHFERGERRQAIALQRRAWMTARPEAKAPLERTLQSFRDSEDRASSSRN